MTIRRFPSLLFAGALALAACGGSDDPADTGDAPVEEPSGGGEDSGSGAPEPETGGDGSESDGTGGEAETPGAAGAAPLVADWSVPVNGSALGSTVAISPDGSQVAFMTGGIQPTIQIHDGATGEVLNSADYHGQGIELVWTDADQLVSWDSERLHVVDAGTLAYPGGVDLTIEPGAEECPMSVFSVAFDRAASAMFISDFHDRGTIVCRLDIDAATITATVIEGQGGLGRAFFRPESGELVVTYSAESVSQIDSVAVLDAATLDVMSWGPTAGPVKAATATDLIVGLDRFTDGFAGTGEPIAAQAGGERFGSALLGSSDGALVVMDATTGAALFTGAAPFRPLDGTDDGTKIVVLLQDSLAQYTLG